MPFHLNHQNLISSSLSKLYKSFKAAVIGALNDSQYTLFIKIKNKKLISQPN